MRRKEWIEEAKTKLDSWNEKLDEIDARASSLKEDARAGYRQTLDEARSHVEAAKTQVAKASDVTGDAWDRTSEVLHRAWTSEKQTIEKALAELSA